MAERRMFAKTIIDSDAFLDMPITARLLYYDLGMRADDDGFVNSPKKIMRITGASQDDLSILIAKKFIIPFENGIVVIKHWRIHNYIRKDTYNETVYTEQKSLLMIDSKGAYTTNPNDGVKLLNDVTGTSRGCDELVDESSTQVRLGKDRLGKDSSGKDRLGNNADAMTDGDLKTKIKYACFVTMEQGEYLKLVDKYGEVFTNKCIEKLDNYKGASGKKYKSDYKAILTWVVDEIERKYPNLKKQPVEKPKEELNELDLLLMGGGGSV